MPQGLQDYFARQWAENFMFYIRVDNAEAWYHHAAKVLESSRYGEARAAPPKRDSHGDLVTCVWDPCGVLLNFTEPAADPDQG